MIKLEEFNSATQKKIFGYIYNINQYIKKLGAYSIQDSIIISDNYFGCLLIPEITDDMKKATATKISLVETLESLNVQIDDPQKLFEMKRDFHKDFESMEYDKINGLTISYLNDIKLNLPIPNQSERMKQVDGMLKELSLANNITIEPFKIDKNFLKKNIFYFKDDKHKIKIKLPVTLFISSKEGSDISLILLQGKSKEVLTGYLYEEFADDFVFFVQKIKIFNTY